VEHPASTAGTGLGGGTELAINKETIAQKNKIVSNYDKEIIQKN
jgi:hypothetical protein